MCVEFEKQIYKVEPNTVAGRSFQMLSFSQMPVNYIFKLDIVYALGSLNFCFLLCFLQIYLKWIRSEIFENSTNYWPEVRLSIKLLLRRTCKGQIIR